MVLLHATKLRHAITTQGFKLKKVNDRYNYEGMEFTASYEASSTFEEISRVCIFIYELGAEGRIKLGQQGRLPHFTHGINYILRTEAANKSL